MTPAEVEHIVTERLGLWASGAVANHATPALLLCIGHDECSGEVHVFVPEDLTDTALVQLLNIAIRKVLRGDTL